MRDLRICGLRLIVITAIIIALVTPAYSADKTTIDLTQIASGARSMSLGGAYTGLSDDTCALFTNPAGLGFQDKISFTSMSTQILTLVDYQMIGFAYPLENGTLGVGYIAANSPAGTHIYYDDLGVTIEGGSMTYFNNMYLVSYGTDISESVADMFRDIGYRPEVTMGGSLKMLSQGLAGDIRNAPSATGYQTDIGLMVKATDKLTLGTTLQNFAGSYVWTTGERERMPVVLKIGSAYKAMQDLTLLLDTDINLLGGRNLAFHGGCEYTMYQMFALRAGFDQKDASVAEGITSIITNYSVGLGLMYQDFKFDYTYKMDTVFQDLSTNYFSVSYSGDFLQVLKADQSDQNLSKTKQNDTNMTEAERDYEKLLKSNGVSMR